LPRFPGINYPYETNVLMKEAADACHSLGLRFKIYNTMRELSNRCREVGGKRAAVVYDMLVLALTCARLRRVR